MLYQFILLLTLSLWWRNLSFFALLLLALLGFHQALIFLDFHVLFILQSFLPPLLDLFLSFLLLLHKFLYLRIRINIRLHSEIPYPLPGYVAPSYSLNFYCDYSEMDEKCSQPFHFNLSLNIHHSFSQSQKPSPWPVASKVFLYYNGLS